MNFYEKLSEYYDQIFPVNEQSIHFIKEKTAKGHLLDIAAGTGNHAISFAKEGYFVTATDIDRNMLNKIIEKANRASTQVETILLAMEDLKTLSDRSYSTIICLGNSLVHLKSLDEISEALTTMYQLLQNDGKLFIQIVNYDRIISEKVTELPLIKRKDVQFRRIYKHVDHKIIFIGELTVEDQTIVNEVPLLPISSKKLIELLHNVGFRQVHLYGSFKGEPYELQSPAIVVEATK